MRNIFVHISVLLLLVGVRLGAQDVLPKKVLENILIDAVAEMQEGDVKSAAGKLNYLHSKDSLDDAVNYYRGLCLYALRDIQGAENSLKAAVALDSLNNAYIEALANFYSSTGRNADAAKIYEKLYTESPAKYNSPYTLTLLGDMYLDSRRDSLAMDSYAKALDLDPEYAPAMLGRAEVYRMSGKTADYFVTVGEFVNSESVNPYAKCDYVNSVLQMVDGKIFRVWHAQLDSLVTGCVNAHPSDSSALKLAGRWFYGTDRKDLGVKFFSELAEAYPEDMSAQMTIMQLRAIEEDWPGALRECERIAALASSKGDVETLLSIYSMMGDTYHQMDDTRNAFLYYKKALKIDPGYVPVLNNYAYYLSLQGRKLSKAAKMSRITVEKEPDNATYLDTYGWILYLQKKYAEAKPLFKHAMIYGGKESAVVLEHYSKVLEALGEKDLAAYYHNLAESKGKK